MPDVTTELKTRRNTMDEFVLQDYDEFIFTHVPEEIRPKLVLQLESGKLGSVTRAKRLMRAKAGYDSFRANLDILVEKVLAVRKLRGAAAHIANLPVRDSVRNTISRMTDAQLEELADTKNVNFESFMKGDDREGLVESILDEMLRS